MDDKSIANMAVLAGEIMLRSGAETYRVEDTIKHILDTAGTSGAGSSSESRNDRTEQDSPVRTESLVMLTGIIVTIERPGQEAVTVMRRVHDRGTNMHRIVEVNEISRKYCAGELSAEETWEKLKSIKGRQYTVWMYNIATVLVPAGFAPLFGGGLREIPAAAAVGVLLAVVMTVGKRLRISSFILNMICAGGVAAAAMALKVWNPALNMDTVIISGIMTLVPGVAITNAIRDTLRGDYISGGARALEAFVTAAAVAIGAGVGIAAMNVFWRGGGLL
jgi:uncharacterized membrane protein YjjP (DUF1212 family)